MADMAEVKNVSPHADCYRLGHVGHFCMVVARLCAFFGFSLWTVEKIENRKFGKLETLNGLEMVV